MHPVIENCSSTCALVYRHMHPHTTCAYSTYGTCLPAWNLCMRVRVQARKKRSRTHEAVVLVFRDQLRPPALRALGGLFDIRKNSATLACTTQTTQNVPSYLRTGMRYEIYERIFFTRQSEASRLNPLLHTRLQIKCPAPAKQWPFFRAYDRTQPCAEDLQANGGPYSGRQVSIHFTDEALIKYPYYSSVLTGS